MSYITKSLPSNDIYTDHELRFSPYDEIVILVNRIPNDQELGEAVRKYIKQHQEKLKNFYNE